MVIAVEKTLDVQKLKKMFKRSVSSISGHAFTVKQPLLFVKRGGGGEGGSYRLVFCSLNLNRLRATFTFKHFCGLKAFIVSIRKSEFNCLNFILWCLEMILSCHKYSVILYLQQHNTGRRLSSVYQLYEQGCGCSSR